jgi:hypothetical protein
LASTDEPIRGGQEKNLSYRKWLHREHGYSPRIPAVFAKNAGNERMVWKSRLPVRMFRHHYNRDDGAGWCSVTH